MNSIPGSCPEPDELGRAGWNILHTAAAVYPNKPSPIQQDGMRKFIEGWSQVYACSHCAYHMRQHVAKHPPILKDKREASWYVCDMHNKVNKILGKDEFNCDPDIVLKRWHPAYPEMDDTPTIEEQIEEIRRQEAAKKNNATGNINNKTSASASASSAKPAGGGFFSWFGGGSKQRDVPPSPAPHTSAATPQNHAAAEDTHRANDTTHSSDHQPMRDLNGRQIPLGGISRMPQNELNADPKVQTRWGDRYDTVFSAEEKGRGAVRSGWSQQANTASPMRSQMSGQLAAGDAMAGLRDVANGNGAATVSPSAAVVTDAGSTSSSAAETDINEIMKKVRACAVYCPEKDKKGPSLGH